MRDKKPLGKHQNIFSYAIVKSGLDNRQAYCKIHILPLIVFPPAYLEEAS